MIFVFLKVETEDARLGLDCRYRRTLIRAEGNKALDFRLRRHSDCNRSIDLELGGYDGRYIPRGCLPSYV